MKEQRTEVEHNQTVDTRLHREIQAALNRLIETGSSADAVFDAAMTVAIAGKCGVAGPRQASRELYLTAAGLFQLADRHEADVVAARH